MPTKSVSQPTASLLDDLIDEICTKLQAGEEIDVEKMALAHPEFADRLQQVCSMVVEMNRWSLASDHTVAPDLRSHLHNEHRLGDYRIARQIGRGGMGIVYEAEQLSMPRRVALKVLPLASLVDPRALQRFKNEVAAVATLQHSHIVPVYAVGEERGIHYYAMQLIRGQSLAAVIRELRARADRDERLSGESIQQAISSMAEEHAAAREADDKQANPNLATEDIHQDSASEQNKRVASLSPQSRASGPNGDRGSPSPQSRVTGPNQNLSLPSPPFWGRGLGEGAQEVEKTPAETRARGRSSTIRRVGDATYFRNVAQLIQQAAEALQHAHDHGIVHRDIKPGNLLLDAHGQLFVTDFGLARIETGAGVTMTGDVLGTLRYMSPEQVQSNRQIVDHRTDIYSLGATLYELLTLQPMWDSDDKAELIRKISLDEPLRPLKINSAIPADLETIVLKAVNKRAVDRYESAQLLGDDLSRWLRSEPIQARRSTTLLYVRKFLFRHRVMFGWISLAALIFLSFGLGVAWWSYKKELVQRLRAQSHFGIATEALTDVVEQASQFDRMIDIEGWRRKTLERAVEYYSRFITAYESDPSSYREMIQVYSDRAKLHLLLGENESAQADALAGIELVEKNSFADSEPIETALLWCRLAIALHEQAKTDEASRAWQTGYSMVLPFFDSKIVSAENNRRTAKFLMSYSDWQLGHGSLFVALDSLKHAEQLCRAAVAHDSRDQSNVSLLADTLRKLGQIYRKANNIPLAKAAYTESIALTDPSSDMRENREAHATSLRELGSLLLEDPRTVDAAYTHLSRSVEIFEELAKEFPWDIYHCADAVQGKHRFSIALRAQGKHEEADRLLDADDETVLGNLNTSQPLPLRYELYWAEFYGFLAAKARLLRQRDAAVSYFDKALERLQQITTRWPSNRDAQEAIASIQIEYARLILAGPNVYGNREVVDQAIARVEEAVDIYLNLQRQFTTLKRLDQQFPEIDDYYSFYLFSAYTALAKSLLGVQRFDEAEIALNKIKTEFEGAVRLRSAKARYQYADTLLDLAGLCLMRDQNPVEVEAKYREGLQVMNDAYAEDPGLFDSAAYANEMQTHYWGLAQALYEQNRFVESKQEFERARTFGNMWLAGLEHYASNLLYCNDPIFQSYADALQCYDEILIRAAQDPEYSANHSFIGQVKQRAGLCCLRLGQYKRAKALFEELLSNPAYKEEADFRTGYYMVLVLSKIEPADDLDGTFHKSNALEGYNMASSTHQQLLFDGKIPEEIRDESKALRLEAAAAVGLDEPPGEEETHSTPSKLDDQPSSDTTSSPKDGGG